MLASVLILAFPALASPVLPSPSPELASGVSKVWTPPYTGGILYIVSKAEPGNGCDSVSDTLSFVLKTGDLLNGAGALATACKPTGNDSHSGAYAKVVRGVGLEIGPSFEGANGTYKIGAEWHFDVELSLDLSGTNCSDASAQVSFGWEIAYLDVKDSKLVVGGNYQVDSHDVSDKAVSSSWPVLGDKTETASVSLVHGQEYDIVIAVWVTLSVDVLNLSNLYKGTCSAAATFTYESSPTAKLLHVALQ
ncbi:MAG TPA: hypothetical protein VEH57_04545 [Thermoplasmata archaeon]|nr:hypothetical protein [Thermoplasmata archaeon]